MPRKEYLMKRLSIIGLAAAAGIALSVGTSAPAQAKIFFSFGVGHGYGYGYGYHHGYGFHRCGWRTVKVRRYHRWVLINRRVCW